MTNENLKIVLDGVRHNYDTVASADDALDGKAGTLLGIEIALGVGYLAFFATELPCISFSALISLMLSAVLLAIIGWPKNYLPAAVDPRKHPEYLSMSEEDLLKQMIVDAQHAIDKNSCQLWWKAWLYRIAIILLIFFAFLAIMKI